MSSPTSAVSVRLSRSLYVSGCPVDGEVVLNFRHIQEDNIQEVHVKLRGFAKTTVKRGNDATYTQTIPLVRDDVSIWCHGAAYPPPGSDVMRFPFQLQLPPNVPPSFQNSSVARLSAIRYAVTAVGVRPGALHFNRRISVPLVVVPADHAGVVVREKLGAIAASGGTYERSAAYKEEKIRRGLWGDYSTVQVHLFLAGIPVYPLYTPIPFIIKVKSISAPLTRAKADALPAEKPAFPPVPTAYEMVEFKLYSKLVVTARGFTDRGTPDVMLFARGRGSTFDTEISERQWVPLSSADEKKDQPDAEGTWVQQVTFRSTFLLDCPPTFSIETIQCQYLLGLKVPFPGIGNNVRIDVPITVTSGINAPLIRDGPSTHEPGAPLSLPPAYWDTTGHEWEDAKN
ncbi:hypothetical protein C2E23DRAFT_901776 [Lenzites betulinus]|nr:hypothetical protein C2E23DRAFT_901776 [Lenzites betulinus]